LFVHIKFKSIKLARWTVFNVEEKKLKVDVLQKFRKSEVQIQYTWESKKFSVSTEKQKYIIAQNENWLSTDQFLRICIITWFSLLRQYRNMARNMK